MSVAREPDLLLAALRRPADALALSPVRWDLLLRQARVAGLLPRLGHHLDAFGGLNQVPSAPQAHLRNAMRLAEAQHAEVRRELDHVREALAQTDIAPVLLKGAAYVAAGLSPAAGRMFSDIDILVPRARLAEVEAALMASGWIGTHHTAYDQRYYREWMHELPPMLHTRRGTVIDVHHAIVPETARVKSDAALLIAAARPLEGATPFHVLAPTDMVLHSMVHLFNNDDLQHALRDLNDIDALLRQFGAGADFWLDLAARAEALRLTRAMHHGLRHAHALLGTPVPPSVLDALRRFDRGGAAQSLSDASWRRALRPRHASARDALTAPALAALYAHAHWLRMPTGLLMRHLAVKALRLHELGERDKTSKA
jgi:Uncharacterised nucleotidyltransferase